MYWGDVLLALHLSMRVPIMASNLECCKFWPVAAIANSDSVKFTHASTVDFTESHTHRCIGLSCKF